jgi:hypothetical protein
MIPVDIATAAFGERPSATGGAIEHDVQRRVLERIGGPAAPRCGVPRRKHAAEHRDDRETVTPAVAQGVDIPPAVAIGGDGCSEVRAGLTDP